MPSKRRAPVMKAEKNPAKYPAKMAGPKHQQKRRSAGKFVRKPSNNAAISDALLSACGYEVIERPDMDDPREMMVDDQPKPHGGPDPFGGDDNIDVDDQIEESMPDCQTETP